MNSPRFFALFDPAPKNLNVEEEEEEEEGEDDEGEDEDDERFRSKNAISLLWAKFCVAVPTTKIGR